MKGIHKLGLLPVVALFLAFALVVQSNPSFSQSISPNSWGLNGNTQWNLISVLPEMVGKNLSQLAFEGCGGPEGRWINSAWLFEDGNWVLVRGTDENLPGLLIDRTALTEEDLEMGMWVNLNTTLAAGKNCVLSLTAPRY